MQWVPGGFGFGGASGQCAPEPRPPLWPEGFSFTGLVVEVRWTPHPVIVTIRDNRDYLRVLLYSYYTTITGWGVLLRLRSVH